MILFRNYQKLRLIKIYNLIVYLKKKLPDLRLIVVISRQSFLNNIGKFILNEVNAHKGSKLGPSLELKILKQHCIVLRKINIFFLSDIYLLCFKKK